MKVHLTRTSCAAVCALICGTAAAAQDDLYKQLGAYDFQTRTAVQAIQQQIDQAAGNPVQLAQIESGLDGVLADPAATFAGKQEACRFLWEIGTARSVPVLSKMLVDEKLCDIARYALERDTDPAAGKALRDALPTVTGKTLVGIIDSIGDRGDAEAAGSLKPFATNADPLVSEAAIAALGKIGNGPAIATLRALPAAGVPQNKALLRAAAHEAATGHRNEAARLYRLLASEDRPPIVQAEAVRGWAAMQPAQAAPVALKALRSSDPYLQEVAARVCGAMPDRGVTSACVTAYPSLPASDQVVLLTAFAERREPSAFPLAQSALQSQDSSVRLAAIQAAARTGGARAVPALVDLAAHGQGAERDAARDALANMPGAEADQAILQAVRQAKPTERGSLVDVLADRGTPAAHATLLEMAQGTDSSSAVNAIHALGRYGSGQEHAALVKIVTTTNSDDVRDAAREAVVNIGQRLGDRNLAVAPIVAALPSAAPGAQAALMSPLAQIGGDAALEALTKAAASPDATIRQAAIGALADSWGDDHALPVLLNAAKSDADKPTRVQALRGYLRIVGQNEDAPAETRVDQVNAALSVAERPEEKRQALGILRDCRTPQSVAAAAKLLDDPETFSDAADTVLYLAAPQKKGDRDVPAVTGPATNSALDKIIQLSKDDAQKAQATKLKSGA